MFNLISESFNSSVSALVALVLFRKFDGIWDAVTVQKTPKSRLALQSTCTSQNGLDVS